MMVEVRFLRHHMPYNGGEIAGFAEEEAVRLIAAGAVELVNPPNVAEVALPSAADLDAAAAEQVIKEATAGAVPESRPRGRGRRG